MIEMLFVLSITCIITMISFSYNIDVSNSKFRMIKELCYQAQFDSYMNKTVNEIEIFGRTMFINEKEYDLYPLTCDNEIFHYNAKGNISNSFTLTCNFNKNYEYRFQLGTGWIAYEE